MIALFCKWLFWIVGAALLGFLLAWLMRGSKAYKWQTQFQDKEAAYNHLKNKHTKFVSNHEELESNHNKLRVNNRNLTANLSTLEKKSARLEQKLSLIPSAVAATPVAKNTNTVKVVDNSYEIQNWKNKYARLERDLASKDNELVNLQDENESLHTKMEVLELTTEEAKKEKVNALSKIKQYEAYRPRFEEANLERNTLKYKYQQLLATRGTVNNDVEGLETKNQVLATELESLKAAMATETAQNSEWRTKFEELTIKTSTEGKKYEEIKVKYDSMLGLQERTEVKMKELSAAIPNPEQIAELAEYKERSEKLRKENISLEEALKEARTKSSTPSPELEEYKQKWEVLNAEKPNWEAKQKQLAEENAQLKATLEKAKADTTVAATPSPELEEYKQKWEVLNAEKPNWEAKQKQLADENAQLKAALNTAKAASLVAVAPSSDSAEYKQKWEVLNAEKPNWEAKQKQLADENAQLKAALEKAKTAATTKAKPATKAEKEAKANRAKEQLTAAIGTKITVATIDNKDDLKLISGVGPFIETKLNNLGIYTFEQVSQFDAELVQLVTDAIQFFPGRILRDDWVGQASSFHKEKEVV